MAVEIQLEPKTRRPSPYLVLQIRFHALRTPVPILQPLKTVWDEGPYTCIPTDMTFSESGLIWGRGWLVPAPPAPLSSIPGLSQSNGIYREGPGFDLGAQGVGGELRNPQHFSLSVSSRRPPAAPAPPRVHTPPLAAAAAELISTTSTYRSRAQCQAGRRCACGGCGPPGR